MALSRCPRARVSASRSTRPPSNASACTRDWIMLSTWRRLVFAIIASFISFTSASAQEPRARGGTLVFGINSGDPPTYDCHQSVLFPIIHLLSPHYSNLLRIDTPNYPKIIGDLADSWTVAGDAKTYTFKLHANVKFHDGSAFSSADIKATYDRIRNPPQGVVSVRRGLVA